ncbi:MAG: SsrA-binding protein SmpB [Thermodesulfobacteriota bacterium]
MKVVAKHPTVRRDYILEEVYETGIVLKGSEVKSLRASNASIKESFAMLRDGEVFLMNSYIAPYSQANVHNHDTTRERKLLLNRREINKLIGKTHQKGYTLIPTKIYFKNGIAKLELGLAKGKKTQDKREDIKRKEAKREMDKAIKRNSRY